MLFYKASDDNFQIMCEEHLGASRTGWRKVTPDLLTRLSDDVPQCDVCCERVAPVEIAPEPRDHDLTNAIQRLRRAGDPNGKTAAKLIEAANTVAKAIVFAARNGKITLAGRTNDPMYLGRGYRVERLDDGGDECWALGYQVSTEWRFFGYEYTSYNSARRLADDIAAGFLDEIGVK